MRRELYAIILLCEFLLDFDTCKIFIAFKGQFYTYQCKIVMYLMFNIYSTKRVREKGKMENNNEWLWSHSPLKGLTGFDFLTQKIELDFLFGCQKENLMLLLKGTGLKWFLAIDRVHKMDCPTEILTR